MQIQITAPHMELTQSLRKFAIDKFSNLERHSDKITKISVNFEVEKLQQKAEATLHIPGDVIHAKSESADLYAAIDLLVDKLDRQLLKWKEKHGHRE